MELFVGIRMVPFQYGMPAGSHLLENDGSGKFTDVTESSAPGLLNIGMVTDMQWADLDGDGDMDMIIAGDWMPVRVLLNENGKFAAPGDGNGLDSTGGWWNRIKAGDFDNDGDLDFIAGNHGMNSRFKASGQKPVSMYVSDFDVNGSIDQVICEYNGDTSYPLALKHDLVNQLPFLKKKYTSYESYKNQTIGDIFNSRQLETAVELHVYQLNSAILINDGKGGFEIRTLPVEAQLSPVYAIGVGDFNDDGNLDAALGGNLYHVKPEIGRYDASFGVLLSGNGDGTFECIMPKESGLMLRGEIRDMISLQTSGGKLLIVARNNNELQIFDY
jgi:hypothetical protein